MARIGAPVRILSCRPDARAGSKSAPAARDKLRVLELERITEGMAACLAGPVVAYMTLVDVLGHQWREQHVAALRAGRQANVPETFRGSVQPHGEASSARE